METNNITKQNICPQQVKKTVRIKKQIFLRLRNMTNKFTLKYVYLRANEIHFNL